MGLSSQHDAGSSTPDRKRCRYCGGRFVTQRGHYGLFLHRGDGDYRIEAALSLHFSEIGAERKAAEDDREPVVRWVSIEEAESCR
jgi:hypothetical protein